MNTSIKEIYNTFLRILKDYGPWQLVEDSQSRKLIECFAMINAQILYENDSKINAQMENLLLNIKLPIQKEFLSLQLNSTENVYLKSGTVVQSNGFFTTCHDTYCVSGQIMAADCILEHGKNYLKLVIQVTTTHNLKTIQIFTSAAIIQTIFKKPTLEGFLRNRNLYYTNCTITHNRQSNWFDYLQSEEMHSFFTISDLKLQAINNILEILIPISASENFTVENFYLNKLIVENSTRIIADPIIVNGPGEYPIILNNNLQIIEIINIYIDGNLIPNIRKDPRGYYLINKNNILYFCLQESYSGLANVDLLAKNIEYQKNKWSFTEYMPCTIRSFEKNHSNANIYIQKNMEKLLYLFKDSKLEWILKIIRLFYVDFQFQIEEKTHMIPGASGPYGVLKKHFYITVNQWHPILYDAIARELQEDEVIIWKVN